MTVESRLLINNSSLAEAVRNVGAGGRRIVIILNIKFINTCTRIRGSRGGSDVLERGEVGDEIKPIKMPENTEIDLINKWKVNRDRNLRNMLG